MVGSLEYKFENDEAEQQQKEAEQQDSTEGLSAQEAKDVKDGKRSVKDIAAERSQLKAAAEAEMNSLVIAKDERGAIIDLREYKGLKRELEETNSAEETKKILDKIRDLPRQKEEEKNKDAEESKEISPEDPKLIKLQTKFDSICRDNVKLIGTKQVESFSKWFTQERRQQPTVKHLKNLIDRLEGKKIPDKNGLAPRREEFNKLQTLYKRYGISDPTESKYIAAEGLSERQAYRKQLESFESHFSKVAGTPFYSKEGIQNMMKGLLVAKTPLELTQAFDQAKKISQKEATGFTYLDASMTIAGKRVRKMSAKSKRMYLEYYKSTDLKERAGLVDNWKALVENEAKLAKELEAVYGNRTDELKIALESFGEMDFMEKQKAIKEHKRIVEANEGKEATEAKLTIKAAHAKIDTATSKKILAKKTSQRYKEWFSDKTNHKDAQGKFSLKKLKKHYELLISDKPDAEAKNLIAYEIKRERFKKEVSALGEINPSLKESQLQKWQDMYDKEGWTGRKSVYKKLKVEQEKQERAVGRKAKMIESAGLKQQDLEQKELGESLEATIDAASELLQNDQAAEAMKVLLNYNEKDPDNPKIMFWINTVAQYMKEFGSGKRKEETLEKEVEKELDEVVTQDKGLQQELEDHQIKGLNLEGAKQNQQKHDGKINAQDRARKESMENVQAGSVEAELTEDAYEKIGKDHVLDSEGKGENVISVDFGYDGLGQEERSNLRNRTEDQQIKLDNSSGFSNVELLNQGRKVSAKEAEVNQAKEAEKISEKLAAKAEERVAAKSGVGEGAKIFDLQSRLAARRKARKLVEDKGNEKLRAA